MKKLLVFITVLALISFAGCAFAVSGGHVNPNAVINLVPAADYTPADEDITGTGCTVTLTETGNTPDSFLVADIYIPNDTANRINVMANVVINVSNYTDGSPVTISFAKYTDTNTTDLYAFIKAKITKDDYSKDKYYPFECKVENEVLSFTVDKPEDFFTENTVVLATAKTVPTGGGSSGGCNAGYVGLLLLAAVPLFFRKK